MMGETLVEQVENSALVVCGADPQNTFKSNKKPLWCDHCQRPHHTKETCWKLHGKPTDWVLGRVRSHVTKAFQTSHESEQSKGPSDTVITKEQMERSYKILSANLITGTSLMA